ncbi:hypothetical protein BO71DRAFT_472827 [Aspergillus ellipticus CBS 707.79]|uniref:Restriction endonuclease type IV Mrr domain-containing protein n=1 Tax=Aspergillus ellipticus CBS 707.79 TaxID=1448320 RepID=A0A319DGW9_9EURO|nr:hypothetical protein BO71DRAFT_472827 [Aspergillus ellipticus CBS 707.79]
MTPLTRRLFKLPPLPPPISTTHHSLPSFLAHAARTALPPTTTTYIGTHYEYTIQSALRRNALLLHRTGGRSDAGTDLLGTWHLPAHEHPLRVLVQCKALKNKLGPNLVRELEGTFARAPVGWRGGGVVGLLVSTREATRGVREALARSAFPVVWLMVEAGGVVRQALWNGRVEELGVQGLGVEVVYPSYTSDEGEGGEEGSEHGGVRLTWEGRELPCMDQVEGDMLRAQERWFALWGVGEDRWEEVVGVVERLFPEEKPLLFARDGR